MLTLGWSGARDGRKGKKRDEEEREREREREREKERERERERESREGEQVDPSNHPMVLGICGITFSHVFSKNNF